MFPELLAALSEGQRAIAHLVVLLVLAGIVALVFLIRYRARRADESERQRVSKEDR